MAFMAEASLFIRTDRARIVFKDCERDAVQVYLCKGELQHELHCFGAIALAPILAVVNANAHKGIARSPVVDDIQVNIAQQPIILDGTDAKIMLRL